MGNVLVLSLGGVLGTLARYYLGIAVHRFTGNAFPYGTLAVNVFGCFLIGFLGTIAESRLSLSPQMKLLLMVGFCGAFTTFSTYIMESNHLLQGGEIFKAAFNITASVLLGFLVFRLGMAVGKLL